LQAAACRLVQAFPEDFRGDFKVYDFGFYLHNENFDGEYPAVFEQVIPNRFQDYDLENELFFL